MAKSMLSFLHANAPAADSLAHLRNQMEAVDHEGMAFLIRLEDINALDAVLQVFDDTQRQRFLANMLWWYFRRDDSLQYADHATAGSADAKTAPYRGTAAQMQRLDELSRPGAMLRFIQTVPRWLGHLVGTPSQAFACIQAALASIDAQAQMHDAESRLASTALKLLEAGQESLEHAAKETLQKFLGRGSVPRL